MKNSRLWMALGALLMIFLIYLATYRAPTPIPGDPGKSFASEPYVMPSELPPASQPDGTPYPQ